MHPATPRSLARIIVFDSLRRHRMHYQRRACDGQTDKRLCCFPDSSSKDPLLSLQDAPTSLLDRVGKTDPRRRRKLKVVVGLWALIKNSRKGTPMLLMSRDTLNDSAGPGEKHQMRASTPVRVNAAENHFCSLPSGTMMLWPVPFDCNLGNMHPDRDKLTVDKKGPELVYSGPARCLERSLCGHHAPVDIVLTAGWRRPRSPSFRNRAFQDRADVAVVGPQHWSRLLSPVACYRDRRRNATRVWFAVSESSGSSHVRCLLL